MEDGRLVGGSGSGISIYNGIGWRNILEIKTSGTLSVGDHSDLNYFIADTVGYDFGEYIADIEQGPDGLVYCAIRGSRVYSANPPRWSGGILVVDIDNPENISIIDTSSQKVIETIFTKNLIEEPRRELYFHIDDELLFLQTATKMHVIDLNSKKIQNTLESYFGGFSLDTELNNIYILELKAESGSVLITDYSLNIIESIFFN